MLPAVHRAYLERGISQVRSLRRLASNLEFTPFEVRRRGILGAFTLRHGDREGSSLVAQADGPAEVDTKIHTQRFDQNNFATTPLLVRCQPCLIATAVQSHDGGCCWLLHRV